LKAGVEHVRHKYGNADVLESEEARILVAFLFAVASHSISDATWHSIGMSNGLLMTLAALDFDGDIDSAHKLLDPGSDIVFGTRMRDVEGGFDWISVNYTSDRCWSNSKKAV
jgi:hypothetical protein